MFCSHCQPSVKSWMTSVSQNIDDINSSGFPSPPSSIFPPLTRTGEIATVHPNSNRSMRNFHAFALPNANTTDVTPTVLNINDPMRINSNNLHKGAQKPTELPISNSFNGSLLHHIWDPNDVSPENVSEKRRSFNTRTITRGFRQKPNNNNNRQPSYSNGKRMRYSSKPDTLSSSESIYTETTQCPAKDQWYA